MQQKIEDFVIKSTSLEHGKELKKFFDGLLPFKSRKLAERCDFYNQFLYYGIVNGVFNGYYSREIGTTPILTLEAAKARYGKNDEIEYKGDLKGFPKEKSDWMLDEQGKQVDSIDTSKFRVEKAEENVQKATINPQPHYDNAKGSLYKIATELGLNHWEFCVFKRLVRCRKKGQFEQDLQK